MELMTASEYMRTRGISRATLSRHARALGIRKTAGVYILSARDVKSLDAAIRAYMDESNK